MHKALALEAIEKEYQRACKRFNSFHSPHEGYAVILEELDQLWGEIKKSDRWMSRLDDVSKIRMRAGATHVAAMALRFLTDCA